jgi:hypothetical protein
MIGKSVGHYGVGAGADQAPHRALLATAKGPLYCSRGIERLGAATPVSVRGGAIAPPRATPLPPGLEPVIDILPG